MLKNTELAEIYLTACSDWGTMKGESELPRTRWRREHGQGQDGGTPVWPAFSGFYSALRK